MLLVGNLQERFLRMFFSKKTDGLNYFSIDNSIAITQPFVTTYERKS